MNNGLPLYFVYDHPKDFPNDFVVRRWMLVKGELIPDKEIMMKTSNYADIKTEMMYMGLTKMARQPDDEPCIKETWI
jgi:hypothetical protein